MDILQVFREWPYLTLFPTAGVFTIFEPRWTQVKRGKGFSWSLEVSF